ncbi:MULTISPECIES: hypothetical protein [unclassified Acinetobacter]|uniref:hypothetical protein n=1 Tax=unclassified Acinetobacter TaxID=196816 RepID=UPI0029345EB2|nr:MULTISPECIES: hypothetical protein [unclassified Acinetobacter]WOE30529.1 hypothetical protein QSG84_08990 [Acinetobacter sp. SAAs470]WOE38720.1 hypothetical protein QSG86_02655 [Acinetobacter sp. SAAs474]
MLNFWYSTRCTRPIKLMFCLGTCLIILLSADPIKLSLQHSIWALSLGALLHVLYILHQQFKQPYIERHVNLILIVLISLILLLVSSSFPSVQRTILTIQYFAFMLLGFFILSIYSNRSKRMSD